MSLDSMRIAWFLGVTGAWAAGLAKLSVLPDAGFFRAAELQAAGFPPISVLLAAGFFRAAGLQRAGLFRMSVLLAAGFFRAAGLLAAGLFRMSVLLAAGFFRDAGLLAAGLFRVVCFLATCALLAAFLCWSGRFVSEPLALAGAVPSLPARPLANACPRGLAWGLPGVPAGRRRGSVKGSLLATGSRFGSGLALGSSLARLAGLPEAPSPFPPDPSVSPASSGGF